MPDNTITIEEEYDYDARRLIVTAGGWSREFSLLEDMIGLHSLGVFQGEELHVGWSKNYNVKHYFGAFPVIYPMKFTVLDEELLVVPAGTFRCYKLSATLRWEKGIQLTITVYVNAQMTLVPKIAMNITWPRMMFTLATELESYSGF